MPKKKWTFYDKLIITRNLWTRFKGGVHTVCGKCGGFEIDLIGQTQSVYTEDGTKFETNREVCRKCGAFGMVCDTWKSKSEMDEEINKMESGF